MTELTERKTSEEAACRFPTCPGHYQRRRIVHHEPFEGHTVFIDGVPADLCAVCGGTLLPAETALRLEAWRDRMEQEQEPAPDRADLYHFEAGTPEPQHAA